MIAADAHIPPYRSDRCLEHYLPVSAGDYSEIHQFLSFEALLLDHCRYRQWLGLLASDFHYRIVDRALDDMASLHLLPAVLEHSHGSIGPHLDGLVRSRQLAPVQVRRLITNLTVSTAVYRQYEIISYLLLNCTSSEYPQGKMFTVERHDRLLRAGRTLRVVKREAIVDQTAQELATLEVLV
jgi:3-phenylpropionate/cinnamic acid dioxygenase small subunit